MISQLPHPGPVGHIIRGSRLVRALALTAAILLCPAISRADETPKDPPAAVTGAQIRQLFDQGNTLFRSALEKAKTDKPGAASLFRDAAAAWRTIALQGRIHNAHLETNIANASLLAGDIPHAIAAFRRAQALDPFDTTIAGGLTAARRAAGTDALAPGASPPTPDAASSGGVRDTLHRVGAALSAAGEKSLLYLPERALLWTAVLCYLASMTLAGVRLLSSRRPPRWSVTALLLLAALSFAPFLARDLSQVPQGVIVAQGQIARSGPADLYDPAFKEPLTPGIEVRIEERRAGWLKVKLADGRQAWIPEQGVEPI